MIFDYSNKNKQIQIFIFEFQRVKFYEPNDSDQLCIILNIFIPRLSFFSYSQV